ncbi:MAG: ATP-dependent RNA helicase HrpA [Candidatus Aminicenantales bacterium]
MPPEKRKYFAPKGPLIRRRPAVSFPPELPITARRREIVRAIKHNPVVIISGETGCGKSTQIPKMCLEAGRGSSGIIGCTQPRRIAAVTIAHRIAHELGEPLGRSVGYKIRFSDKTSPQACIKIMTDGILLAELQSNPRLMAYDALIIDEAHERSLNIDFLLGITRTLLPLRPDLKVVITSATLDTEKFSKAFNGAPVIHIGGRMYPVDVEYIDDEIPSAGSDEFDYIDRTVQAADHLKSKKQSGDILIFMPTEQDILETCERLEGRKYPGTTVLPLYARLPASHQGRVYSVKGPKIVVATNVAETSLTIPGIRYVIDTGLARIAQYQPGSRINSLPVSPISRSSADQRMGRCGRLEAGLCVRLFSREDYEARLQFTSPEILRSNLAEVILRMMFLGLGNPSEFPFVDRPDPKNIKDGYETLLELEAIAGKAPDFRLTSLGRRMARIPLDPRISRMLLEADREGCLREVAVIASVLGIRDPRERPPEKAAQADESQAAFIHPDSDFLTLLNIWDSASSAEEKPVSKSEQRKYCREHFLSFPRMREWKYVHNQILSILEEQKRRPGRKEKTEISASLYAGIHKSVLSGFLSSIAANKEKNIYTAAKGREVMLFPGSGLFNKCRPWIVAAEIVRTSRLFARTAAKIDPAWLEELGRNQCRYSYSEPYWDKNRGEVRAKQRVTLYGLEIVSGRDVPYGPVNPEDAHRIFIRSGLVEGRFREPPAFLKYNLDLRQKASALEEKLRRRDILVSEDTLAGFYSRRLAGVYDLRGLEQRIRAGGNDEFLKMSVKDLLLFFPDEKELVRYPDELILDGRPVQASYKFSPGEDNDGITLKIPTPLVPHIPAEPLEWGVPGYFREKISALIKGLPKRYRKQLVPVSQTADIIVKEMQKKEESLFHSLARFVRERFRVDIPASEWAKAEIPKYLTVRLAAIDSSGREIASGRNLDGVRKAVVSAVLSSSHLEDSQQWRAARETWEKTGISSWDFGELPEAVSIGTLMNAYPGLEPADNGVNLRLFRTKEDALSSHVRGVETLFLIRFARDLKFMQRYLLLPEEYGKTALFFGGKDRVEKGMIENLKREVFQINLRTEREFEAHTKAAVRTLFEKGHWLRERTLEILDAYRGVQEALQKIEQSGSSRTAAAAICTSIRDELKVLVSADFLELYPMERLAHIRRYLEGMRLRAERGKNDPGKDAKKAAQIVPFTDALNRMKAGLTPPVSPEKKKVLEEFRWMIEEFKVSLFAPELRTSFPVSAKRLAAKLHDIEQMD